MRIVSVSFEQFVHALTTRIEVKRGKYVTQGSGFYYYTFNKDNVGPDDPPDKVWLVTNRHVLLPRIKKEGVEFESLPESLTFFLRVPHKNGLRWYPIKIDLDHLITRAKIHSNDKVDIALFEVKDFVESKMNLKNGPPASTIAGLEKTKLPSNNLLDASLGDEALVIGYPSGYYDQFNLFPIVKSGVIASGWGYQFEGLPAFLIDAKLFPGSSGSLVISRPVDIVNIQGSIRTSKQKQYLFLGVFSGEPFISETMLELDDITIVRKSGLNTGLVWYGHLVEEIIANGLSIKGIDYHA